MKLPSAAEYLEIVDKKNPGNLSTLYNHQFIRKENHTYLNKTSRSTILFKTEYQSKFYAVRFFLKDDEELFRRYRQIENYLSPKSLSWKVPFRFMHEEYYPVVLMDWMDSLSFTEYLDRIINQPLLIGRLQQELISLSQNLERNKIGHGNLNMKHVRFVIQDQDYILKLIDYDSMFIPPFAGKDSMTAGTPGFQHPMRLASDFSETIDRFSIWIFVTALEAFKANPLLWTNERQNGFNKEEQVFFTYRDLVFPQQSAAFDTIRGLNNAALNFYCTRLVAFCNAPSPDQVEVPRLFGEKETYLTSTSTRQSSSSKDSSAPVETIPVQKVTQPAREAITPVEKAIGTPGAKNKGNGNLFPEQKIQKEEPKNRSSSISRKRKKPITAFLIITILLLSIVAYIAWNNQTRKDNSLAAAIPKESSAGEHPVAKKQAPQPKGTVFTPANINQFLFQLYQSYNKRDLSSILSNYADNLNQYYDAGALSKNKLSAVIKNLFIKPAHYESHPDLKALTINDLGDSCKIIIPLTESIKANKRSKTQNFSSKIEYTIDPSFKIIAEKNRD